MKPGALKKLGERYGLVESAQAQLATVLAQVAEDERAPTTVRDPSRALDVHLADSLTALELGVFDTLEGAARLADIGAGAGFPGLALAIALPASEVWLVESQARKCMFIERVCVAAQIANARVVCARAEEWRDGLEAHDVVLARALAPQPVVLEYAAPLLRRRGKLIDWRGQRNPDEEQRAASAAVELGMRIAEIRRVEPYAGARDHHLHVYEKVRETPARFPRRTGVARKRPLGC